MFKTFSQLLGPDSKFLNQYLMKVVMYGILSGLTITFSIPLFIYTLKGEIYEASLWSIPLLFGVLICWKLRQLTERAGIKVGEAILRNARHRIGHHVASLPIGWFKPQNRSRLSHVISKGVIEVAQLPAHLITPVVSGAIAPLILVIALLILHTPLGLIALVSLPIIAAGLLLSTYIGAKADQDFNRSSAQTSQRIVEFAQSQSVLRAFSSAGNSTRFLEAAVGKQQQSARKLILMTTLSIIMGSWLVQAVFVVLFYVVMIWLKPLLGLDVQPVEIISVIASLVLITRFIDPIQEVANYGEALRSAKGHLKAVDEIFMIQPLMLSESPLAPKNNSITLNKISFSYQDDEESVLSDIDAEILSGTMVALIGASGSGKTTLVRLIARFFDVTRGEIRIGDVNVKDISESTLTSSISQIFQDSYLFQGTIKENILIGKFNATDDEIEQVLAQAGLQETIEQLPEGLETYVGEGGAMLSGGERQRVSIARALIKDAPILLVDEATAALDAENQAIITDTLARLKGTKTIVVIAHQLSTIEMADQIIVLDKGYIVERGTHSQLMQQDGQYSFFVQQRARAKGWVIV